MSAVTENAGASGWRGRLRQHVRQFTQTSFVRSVGLLVGSSLIAQIITFAALWAAARIYTPEHFRLLSVTMSIVGTFGAVACLRLELAIPQPEDEADGRDLLTVSLLSSLVMAAAVALGAVLAADYLAGSVYRSPHAAAYLWLLPVGVGAYGAFSALQMWHVRKKTFNELARTRISQAVLTSATQIGLGLAGLKPLGLLLAAAIVNTGSAAALLSRRAFQSDVAPRTKPLISRAKALIARYRNYPTFSTLETFCNSGSYQLPLLIIAAAASGPEAGYLMLAITVMQAPITLLGQAVSQVYLSRSAEAHRTGTLDALTSSVLLGLIKSGMGPLIFAGLTAPLIFPLVFGQAWTRAGELAGWMTPWVVAQLLAVPVGTGFYAAERQKLSLFVQAIGFAVRMGLVAAAWKLAPAYMPEAYAAGGFVYYLLYLLGVLAATGLSPMRLLPHLKAALPILGFWIVLGLAARYALAWATRGI